MKKAIFSYRLFLILSLTLLGACSSTPSGDLAPTVLLISFDGYRWDYLDKYPAPVLRQMATNGVRVKQLKPIFPTVTFPNHYSLVTGKYAEGHGIVGNEMHDPRTNHHFSLAPADRPSVDSSEWWEGEPIWVTLEKRGIKTGTMFWVGANATIQGIRASYNVDYDPKMPYDARVKQVLSWIDLPVEKRPRFLTLYFEAVDSAGHAAGSDSPEVAKAVSAVDEALALLLSGLKERGLQDKIDIIVVSDHGMTEIGSEKTIPLEKYLSAGLKKKEVTFYSAGPFASIWPKPGTEEKWYKKLQKAHTRMQVFRKKEIPERYHYRSHPRIPPLLAVADEGWFILRAGMKPEQVKGGAHGYDNELASMQATLVAQGPHFKNGFQIDSLSNLDVYPLIFRLLGSEPLAHEGDAGRAEPLLKK